MFTHSSRGVTLWLLCISLLIACGGDRPTSSPPAGSGGASADGKGDPFCRDFNALAAEVGCEPLETCPHVTHGCEAAVNAWLVCLRADPSQCLCESDGEINCEGSFKPDEGPAKCVAQYEAVASCESQ